MTKPGNVLVPRTGQPRLRLRLIGLLSRMTSAKSFRRVQIVLVCTSSLSQMCLDLRIDSFYSLSFLPV